MITCIKNYKGFVLFNYGVAELTSSYISIFRYLLVTSWLHVCCQK